MKKSYIALLSGIRNEEVTVSFPDFPGCISAGNGIAEALKNGREALEFHLCGMIEGKLPIPEADAGRLREGLEIDPECRPALVEVTVPDMHKERVNITMSRYALDKIDAFIEQHSGNRSALLELAVLDYISRQ